MEENNEEIKEEVKNIEKQELNNNKVLEEPKRKMKIKVWVLLVILIVLVVIRLVVWGRSAEDNCTHNCSEQNNEINNVVNNNHTHPGKPLTPMDVIDIDADYKPIIYIYPKQEINVTVKLGRKENITCSYPKYEDEWNVKAKSDGTLIDLDTGRNLYALYWEGIDTIKDEIKEGFIVKGEDTIKFLEEKLEILGLNEREAEEFIVYWLPILQANKYNYIRFASMEEINANMPLEFSVKPDTLIRVLMEFKGLDKYIEVPEQKLQTPERKGFVVVEWGGTELK